MEYPGLRLTEKWSVPQGSRPEDETPSVWAVFSFKGTGLPLYI